MFNQKTIFFPPSAEVRADRAGQIQSLKNYISTRLSFKIATPVYVCVYNVIQENAIFLLALDRRIKGNFYFLYFQMLYS